LLQKASVAVARGWHRQRQQEFPFLDAFVIEMQIEGAPYTPPAPGEYPLAALADDSRRG
jgi:hypothetical protein